MKNKIDPPCSRESNTYQTGNTRPPKSHTALIAFLLVLVIFLCGAVTALSLTNIRLFRQLSKTQDENVLPFSFFAGRETAPTSETRSPADLFRDTSGNTPGKASLGVEGEELSTFYQLYYHLPQGFYVNEVTRGSSAYKAGLRAGDILLSLDGYAISCPEDLTGILSGYRPGQTVHLVFCRGNRQLQISFPLDEAK